MRYFNSFSINHDDTRDAVVVDCGAAWAAEAVYKQKPGSHTERKHRALLTQRPVHNNLDRKLYTGYIFVLTKE